MAEVDEDKSGTIDFYEFVNVYLMLSKGEGISTNFAGFIKHKCLILQEKLN